MDSETDSEYSQNRFDIHIYLFIHKPQLHLTSFNKREDDSVTERMGVIKMQICLLTSSLRILLRVEND